MKSVERRFKKILKKNPCWSSYVCFAETCNSQDFQKKTIYFWFNKLVDKNDYDKKEKKLILSHLRSLSRKEGKQP